MSRVTEIKVETCMDIVDGKILSNKYLGYDACEDILCDTWVFMKNEEGIEKTRV